MKKFSTYFILLLFVVCAGFVTRFQAQAAATVPYTQNFNTANDFTFLNGTQTNKWFYGTAFGNPGGAIYISNNNGVANEYTITTNNVVQAYRDIIIPAGTTAANVATLNFNWKAQGESCCDYLRVWLVPATFTPTVGTQITAGAGRIQVGGNLNLQNTWQTFSNTTLNVSTFAGTTMRLVFEWRNDTSIGTQPAGAIDNVEFLIPTCTAPTNLAVGTITTTNATFSWTALTPAPANGYQYYFSTSSTPPNAGTAPTGTTATNSVTVNTLAPSTTYFWWVRAVCSGTDSSTWSAGGSFNTVQIPATMPYTQPFNAANDFALVNGTQTNKWFYGTAFGNPGGSLYISDNNGTSNSYTITSTSVVQAYRDIAVPAGTTATTPAILSFDWKAVGESSFDYIRVWLVPTTFTPTPGTQITAGAGRIQVGGNLNQQAGWQNYINTNVNLASFAGSTLRLVFEWRNDGSGGTQPPASIDNINLLIPTCKVPTGLTVGTVAATTAGISWTGTTPAPALGYQYYVSTSSAPPTGATVPTGTTTATNATLNSLLPNTVYYFWVRAVCSTTDSSLWITGPSFTTTQIPATLPYVQPFTANDFGFTTAGQTNQWKWGSATGNPANAIYVSNDNGVTNSYNLSSTSVTHAYRDIAIPAGTTNATFSFDWKAQGESTLDYLRVWLVPANFLPVAGTLITAGTGRIQVGTNYNLQGTWQSYLNNTQNLGTFAGTTMRLVFEWRNDGSLGTQPPAAVDNVRILVCSTATPTVTLGAVTFNSVVVNWNQDLGGATYIIRYRPVGSTAPYQTLNVAAAPFPATTNTSTVTGLLPATQYEIGVAAVCNGTAGNYTSNTFTTRCDPTPPTVTISNVTSTSAVVTWNPLAASSTYIIRWRPVGTTTWNTPTAPAPPANSITLTGLTSFVTYEVQVANICNGETVPNPWSNTVVFTTVRVCEIAPPGLTITQLNPTTAEVTWDPFPGATSYTLRYRKVGLPGFTTLTVPTNTYIITGLLELTQYEMQVANVCGTSNGNFTPLYLFTTPTITYCNMSSGNSASEYISKVRVVPTGKTVMENTSLGSNYTSYIGVQDKLIEMIQGSVNNQITVDKVLNGGANGGVAVWIDFNRNGIFDIDERILASGPNNSTTATATFTVPTSAFVSNSTFQYVVMRVALQKDGIPVNCTNFANGEVEDYSVRISKAPLANSVDQTQIILYPNPVKSELNIKNISRKANYKIYSAAGQLVGQGLIVNNKVNVMGLVNGLYVIEIEDAQFGTIQKKFIKE
ncbi:hypothetical protein ASG01_11820 [Chryseobacterium sp. Leaf180]|uniref:fibronectin type III domain-containing protein n=1 Tax=Chryseobacterium sp. Leaf180 TaxID=1736289 RepID=UPI0006F28D1E|nr:fibronectin type III domain-containing protein [Chryseobacterium sp. Leaf180]KQR92586.1 hypothetical protein ASG01_11820 [Chryseobacterium sp. Leaf180]